MGPASVVLGIAGIILAVVPSFAVTQMIGVVLGVLALSLGVLARRRAATQGSATGSATAGIVLGASALLLSALLFAACQYCKRAVGRRIEKGASAAGHVEQGQREEAFRKKLHEALLQARERDAKK